METPINVHIYVVTDPQSKKSRILTITEAEGGATARTKIEQIKAIRAKVVSYDETDPEFYYFGVCERAREDTIKELLGALCDWKKTTIDTLRSKVAIKIKNRIRWGNNNEPRADIAEADPADI